MLALNKFTSNINLFVRGGTAVAATNDKERKYYQNIDEIVNSLYKKQLPFTAKNPRNQDSLNTILNDAQLIPDIKLPELSLNTDSFSADPIKYEKDDTKEIKQLIQKINKKIACHTCDHTKLEKLQLGYVKDVVELRNSKNLEIVHKYYNMLAQYCSSIRAADENPKYIQKNISYEEKYYDESFTYDDPVELKKAQKAAIDFNTEVLAMKTKYLATHCVHCEKLQKEYEWYLSEIDRLRQEHAAEREEQIKRIQEEIENPPIIDFMNEYFKDKERVKLGDIARLWKAVKGKSIKQDDLTGMLEETEQWKVTNTHNIKYANKNKQ